MALLGALCVGLNALGFTNRSLRAQVSHLLGVAYTVNQASYDLARLRLNGLIERRPGTNTYDLTPDGLRVAIFYTKVYDRLLRPLIAANAPPAPLPLRAALLTIDRHVRADINQARLVTPPETQDGRQNSAALASLAPSGNGGVCSSCNADQAVLPSSTDRHPQLSASASTSISPRPASSA
jgi:hypothetical protein